MNDEDDRDARLSRAALRAVAVSAPAELKAALKRLARGRRSRLDWLQRLRIALPAGAWRWGGGAAFAAAALALALWREPPGDAGSGAQVSQPASQTPVAAAERAEAEALARLSRELWSEEEGGDDDVD